MSIIGQHFMHKLMASRSILFMFSRIFCGLVLWKLEVSGTIYCLFLSLYTTITIIIAFPWPCLRLCKVGIAIF